MTEATPGEWPGGARQRGVSTFRGEVDAGELGVTLIHEHIFVRHQELERNMPALGWNESQAVDLAVRQLSALHGLGVRTVVDLTVVGLGRDVSLVAEVADRVAINLIASTGLYSAAGVPLYFEFRGPGRLIDEPDPLTELFVRDIEEGIGGTTIRAGMIKVMSAGAVLSAAEERVLSAAAIAHQQTGVPITTHSEARQRNGLGQQSFLVARGVSPDRIIIGHSGDTDDLDYLRAIMDNGSTIGLDRFGMEHVMGDDARIATVVALAGLGYADRMVLSHDAACFSYVTPPSWRAAHAPHWDMAHLFRRVLPALLERGVSRMDLDRMLVLNPSRLLEPAKESVGRTEPTRIGEDVTC